MPRQNDAGVLSVAALSGGCGLLSVQDVAGLMIELEGVAGNDWEDVAL